MPMRSLRSAILVALLAVSFSTSQAASVVLNSPAANRWMYPFGNAVEDRQNASVFGATGDPMFDEHDAQYLLGFNTGAAGVPTGAGASNYQITSITLELTVQGLGGPTFAYDPTYDSYKTYSTDPDTDTGRPVELYGIGFKNGYTGFTLTGPDNTTPNWSFKSNFSPPGPPAADRRSAYALGSNGSSLVDVTNNLGTNGVTGGFETTPLAIGSITGLAAGALVPDDAKMIFSLDVSNPLYLAYLQSALDAGQLGLAVASGHEAAQGAPPTYPIFDTLHTPGGSPAKLTIEYTIVPEPSSVALALLGLAAAVPFARRRRR